MKGSNRTEAVEQVRLNTDIVEVISAYVNLTKRGKNYIGLCPFHHEKTPSFSVNPDGQYYKCFGCGEGGDVFDFVMKNENLSFPEALRQLAERAGISIAAENTEQSAAELAAQQHKMRIYTLNESAAGYFSTLLQASEARMARAYLQKRGVTAEVLQRFRLGFTGQRWDGLLQWFNAQTVKPDQLLEAGLVIAKKEGNGCYDRFRNRIIFPIFDVQHRIVGFGGRVMDSSQPKYLNTSETILFNKRAVLYALNFAKEAIRKAGYAVIVEGYMDALTAHQFGMQNVVASMGTALAEEQAELLRRYTTEVVIAYDTDTAGKAATLRGIEILQQAGIGVRIIALPTGKDPDEFIRSQGVEVFRRLAEEAVSVYEFKIAQVVQNYNKATITGKVKIINKCLPIIQEVNNEVAKAEYIRQLAAELEITEESIKKELTRIITKGNAKYMAEMDNGRRMWHNNDVDKGYVRTKTRYRSQAPQLSKPPAYFQAEQGLIYLLLTEMPLITRVVGQITASDFSKEAHRSIVEALLLLHERGINLDREQIVNYFAQHPDRNCVNEILLQKDEYVEHSAKEQAIDDFVRKIKVHRLKEKLLLIQKLITEAEKKMVSGEKVQELLQEYEKYHLEYINYNRHID